VRDPFSRCENGEKEAALKCTRNANGRFAPGNPGGPGRPRRAVEREYMAVLSQSVDLKAWRRICNKAVEDAEAGDRYAREWISRYLLGEEKPMSLRDLAADEAAGYTVDNEIRELSKDRQGTRLRDMNSQDTFLRRLGLA
jgi:hypothetical protein